METAGNYHFCTEGHVSMWQGGGGHEAPWASGATGLVLDRSLASHLNHSKSQFLIVKVEGQTSRFLRIFPNYYIYDLFRAAGSKG